MKSDHEGKRFGLLVELEVCSEHKLAANNERQKRKKSVCIEFRIVSTRTNDPALIGGKGDQNVQVSYRWRSFQLGISVRICRLWSTLDYGHQRSETKENKTA